MNQCVSRIWETAAESFSLNRLDNSSVFIDVSQFSGSGGVSACA